MSFRVTTLLWLLAVVPFGPLLAWKRGDLVAAAERLMAAAAVAQLENEIGAIGLFDLAADAASLLRRGCGGERHRHDKPDRQFHDVSHCSSHPARRPGADRGVHRVLGFWPVDGDDQDAVTLLDQDG